MLPEGLKQKKIAIAHDWLTGMRGGEKVLEQILKVLGPRDIYTLVAIPENMSPIFQACPIHTSFIQRLPFGAKKYQYYLPFFPLAIEHFDFSDYDIVVSMSTCAAKGIITRPRTFHFSCVNTPVRYAWDFYKTYLQSARPKFIMKYVWPLVMHYFRNWDVNSAHRVDCFISNSDNVARRIKKYYRREAITLYPPVDCERMSPGSAKEDYYFVLSALVPYKRIDLAVKACRRLKRKLIIAGEGAEYKSLKSLAAGADVKFVGWVSDQQAVELYQKARAFIFPGEEDFGITPLEAQACGTPVLAFGRGGALETIRPGEGGWFFYEQTEEAIVLALQEMEKMTFPIDKMLAWTKTFSNECFQKRFVRLLSEQYNSYQQKFAGEFFHEATTSV